MQTAKTAKLLKMLFAAAFQHGKFYYLIMLKILVLV